MPLPLQAVDHVIERLHATYGMEWVRKWDGLEPQAVKTIWMNELDSFASSMGRIVWALENLPARCPNAVEFRHLCRQAPAPDEPALPAPQADPKRVRAELAKLGALRPAQANTASLYHKEWARRLIARSEAGERVRPLSLRFAQEALRTHLPAAA